MGNDRRKINHKKLGTGLMIGGLFLLVLAALLIGYNTWDNHRAGETSAQVLQQLSPTNDTPEGEGDLPLYLTNPDIEMPTTTIDGHDYIGWVEIPALSLSLPIMSQWDYDNLKLAPCRYTGSAYKGNLVIAGHNYRSHFGSLKRLTIGDQVLFTDADGNEFLYQVSALEQLGATDIEAMTDSGYPLTLFTCTLGGTCRLAVRCVEAS